MTDLFDTATPESALGFGAYMAVDAKSQSHGARANKSGSVFEDIIEFIARRYGVPSIQYNEWQHDTTTRFLLVRRVPYTNLFGEISYTEFVFWDQLYDRKIRIEAKWQKASGSIDEKFKMLFDNAKDHMPESEIYLVIDGNGYRKRRRDWLEERAKETQKKTIHVGTLGEFLGWFSDLMDAPA